MKRTIIERKLRAAGVELREGAKHTKLYIAGRKISTLPRHREIDDRLVREIEKQTGVKLR